MSSIFQSKLLNRDREHEAEDIPSTVDEGSSLQDASQDSGSPHETAPGQGSGSVVQTREAYLKKGEDLIRSLL